MFLGQTLCSHSTSLHLRVYMGISELNVMEYYLIQGGVENTPGHFIIAKIEDTCELWADGSLGSYADLSFTTNTTGQWWIWERGPGPPLFWVKKEETTEGRKASRQAKQLPPPPPPSHNVRSGSATDYSWQFTIKCPPGFSL